MRRIRDVEDLDPRLQILRTLQMEGPEEAHVQVGITRAAHRVEPSGAEPRLSDRFECGRIEPGVVDADAAEDLHFVFHLIGALQKRYALTDIALAGGCAMNSVANGKIRRVTPFRRVYVQSAAGDAGGAVGAAYAVWHQCGGARSFVMDHAYLGPQFTRAEIADLLAAEHSRIAERGCSVEELDEAELCRRTARAIGNGLPASAARE